MGALDLISKAAKAVKKSPFFSKADEVLEELPRGKGTGDEFLTEMVKKGAKPTELKERGIEKALKGKPKMTKAEVKKVFEEKAPPMVQETVYRDVSPDYDEFLEKRAQERFGADWWELSRAEQNIIRDEFDKLPATKYEQYKTPGGENYREILLKLPTQEFKPGDKIQGGTVNWKNVDGSYNVTMPDGSRRVIGLETRGDVYSSSHWPGEPNVLAHIRVQDFKTPDGKKVLLVDEIQSDWHQEGRKKGYRGQESEKISDEEYKRGVALQQRSVRGEPMTQEEVAEMNDILQRHAQSIPGMRVPDAPFKKNWHELAMKRVLDYAAEKGYDTVAITPGAEQAKRYDLSKHINDLEWDSQTGSLKAWDHSGNRVISQSGVSEQDLPTYIGKEAAQRLLEKEHPTKQLFGVDLQIGGEGMKGFYDKILTDYLNTYGKQYGASVGQFDLVTQPSRIEQAGKSFYQTPQKTMPVHRFDITPQMREQIKTKGQPLYSKFGPEAAAGTGAVGLGAQQSIDEQPVQNPVHFTENPDAMLLELTQRN